MTKSINIWGLGVGPGDPELITLKALRILQKVDIIAYPALLGGKSIVRSIVDRHLIKNTQEIEISIPMEANRYPARDVFDSSAREIASLATSGKLIAILCEGDPFFYGSFMYLFARLSVKLNVEVVPGVTSLTACAAQVGFPLAARNDTISVIPAPLEESVLREKLLGANVAAIIKVGKHIKKVRNIIKEMGILNKAYYIERATFEEERIATLEEFTDDIAPYFSMILVYVTGEILEIKR